MSFSDEELEDLVPKPVYPEWQLDENGKNVLSTNKPSVQYVTEAISSDQMRHARLIQRFKDDLRWYRLLQPSWFEDYDADDLEIFTAIDIPGNVTKIANMVDAIDAIFEWAYGNSQERKDSQLLEDFSHWCLDQLVIQYGYDGNTLIKWDWTWYACVYGRVVSRILPDLTDPDFPWDYTLMDPATVYPVFGNKRGLTRVSVIYNETADVMLQRFGTNKKFVKKLTQKQKTREQDSGRPQLDYVGEVREYYDQWWRYVEFDGCEALPITAHELGYVPFVYTIGPGEAGSAASPVGGRLTRREALDGLVESNLGVDQDLERKGVCFFQNAKPTINQLEKVLGLAMTKVKQNLNPPVAIESPYEEHTTVDMRTGATTKLKPGEKLHNLLQGINQGDIVPILQKLQSDISKTLLPDALFGVIDHSNVSGFAASTMLATARDQVLPIIRVVERHIADVIDMMLRQYRDQGFMVKDQFPVTTRGRYAGASTPEDSPMPPVQVMAMLTQALSMGDPSGMSAAFNSNALSRMTPGQQSPRVIDRDLIIRMGSRPVVKLETLALQDRTAMANFASMMVEGKMMSRFRAMSEVGVQNPEKEWEQIIAEDAETMPEMLKLVTFPEMLWKNGDMGRFAAYFAAVLWPQLLQTMMTGGLPGQQPPGGGGPGAPPEGPQTTQGTSQPMVGQGPGPGSGPPSGGPVAPDPNAGGGIPGGG